MKNLLTYIIIFILIGQTFRLSSIKDELKDLNSKIDKIVIFLDLDAEDEVVE